MNVGRMLRLAFWTAVVVLDLPVAMVMAAGTTTDWTEIYNRLKTIVTAVNIMAWVGVFLGWAMGIFTRILPIPSREVKQTGQSWTEWAGIGAFLLASGLTVINLMLWIFGAQLPPEVG